MRTEINYHDFCEVLSSLENCHAIFATIWASIVPIIDDEVEVNSINFNRDTREIEFIISKRFWDETDMYAKSFVLAHQAMHLVLHHPYRALRFPKEHAEIIHLAMDLSVNQILVVSFGFKREWLSIVDELIWPDKVFDSFPFEKILSFEEYYRMLLSMAPEDLPKMSGATGESTESGSGDSEKSDSSNPASGSLDSHEEMIDAVEESLAPDRMVENLSDAIVTGNCDSELEDFSKKIKEASEKPDKTDKSGKLPSNSFGYVGEPLIASNIKRALEFRKIKHKPKWETVIKKWADFSIGEKEEYQWVIENRRFSILNNNELSIPQETTVEHRNYEKLNVMFFLDTSGSCYELADRFFKAALSLNPLRFNVRLFGRSTVVEELDIELVKKGKIEFHGSGSDDFRCIENFIQKELKAGRISKYPNAVFHITDGHDCSGQMVNPQIPENWYWFLSNNSTERWIPKRCNIFKLQNFE